MLKTLKMFVFCYILYREVTLGLYGYYTETNLAGQSTTVKEPIKQKRKADMDIDVLHREVLRLQKEKLMLKIKILRKQVATVSDASTQTDVGVDPYSFLKDLIAP